MLRIIACLLDYSMFMIENCANSSLICPRLMHSGIFGVLTLFIVT